MRRIATPALILLGILLIPILPFALFGETLEPWLESLLDETGWGERPGMSAAIVIGALSADILLPIPSSNVCTFAGRVLGSGWGAATAWLGLNIACAVGYLLAATAGWPVVKRLTGPAAMEEMQMQVNRFGIGTLVLFRAVPILAEASVLWMGLYRMSPRRFWPPVLLANLGLAIAYAVLGDVASRHGWFGLAMSIAFAVPAVLAAGWWLLRRPAGKTSGGRTG